MLTGLPESPSETFLLLCVLEVEVGSGINKFSLDAASNVCLDKENFASVPHPCVAEAVNKVRTYSLCVCLKKLILSSSEYFTPLKHK